MYIKHPLHRQVNILFQLLNEGLYLHTLLVCSVSKKEETTNKGGSIQKRKKYLNDLSGNCTEEYGI